MQFALFFLAAGVLGIYPDGHFDLVSKLDTENFNDFITSNVDAGKTAFVRFIASSG